MKTLLNKIIDFFFEKKRTKKQYRPLTNQKLIDGLANGKLFVACIIGRDKKNFIAQQIRKFSGPFVHTEAIADITKTFLVNDEIKRLTKKFRSYYNNCEKSFPEYIVMASAKDTGMEYYDLAEDQNREMIVFHINGSVDPISEDYPRSFERVIIEFLSAKVMNANYDYTGLVGQIFRKLGKWFYSLWDDERAWYCSEQAEIFKRHGVKIADVDEPTPTEIYKYCKKHYPVVYSSLVKEY